LPKYLNSADAAKLRLKGKIKPLGGGEDRLLPDKVQPKEAAEPVKPPARNESYELMLLLLSRVVKVQEQLAVPRPSAWDFTIERDADGRIKKVLAKS
jgi:hypothetical protein